MVTSFSPISFCDSFLFAFLYISDGLAGALEHPYTAEPCQQAVCDCSMCSWHFTEHVLLQQ